VGHTQPWQRVEGRGPSRLLFALVAASCAMSLLVVTKYSSAAGTSAAAAAGQPTWTPRVSPRGIDTLSDVVCPSAISCYAVGEYESTGPGSIIGSSDGGDHWQRLMVTPKRVQPIAIACPTPSTCVVAGEITPPGWPKVDANAPLPSEHAEALLTTDDGAHWSSETLPKVGGVIGVTCASVSVCLVVGYRGGIARTTNGGETWRTETMPRRLAMIDSVACPTTTFCILGGTGSSPGPSVYSVSQDSGATWSNAAAVAGPLKLHDVGPLFHKDSVVPTALGALSCSDAQHCVGLILNSSPSGNGRGSPMVTSDGGGTWTRGSRPVGAAVSCAENFCVSIGKAGDAFISTNGGVNWGTLEIPTRLNPPDETVICTSSTHCVAVGASPSNDK
jgi:photosystem II stability/assembly factor-like uncharacterized protein